ALGLAQSLNDAPLISQAFHNLAQIEIFQAHLRKADYYNQEALKALGPAADSHKDPYLLLTTAEIAQGRRQFASAEKILLEIIHRPEIDTSLKWQAQSDLANVYIAQHQMAKADRQFRDALGTVETARSKVRQE